MLFNSCCIPGSDMVTRTKTSECDATALKTENDLTLSGIIVRADRGGSRRQQREVQNLTRKYHILPYMYHNDVGIVKSREFLLGKEYDTDFEKGVKNVSLLECPPVFLVFTFPGQAGNENVKMFCESLFFQIYWTVKTQEILCGWEKNLHKPRNQILSLGIFTVTDNMTINMMLRGTQGETAITSVSSMHDESETPVKFSSSFVFPGSALHYTVIYISKIICIKLLDFLWAFSTIILGERERWSLLRALWFISNEL